MNCAVNKMDNSTTKDRQEIDRFTSARYQNLAFENMHDLQRRRKLCDITLKVRGKNYFAHRVVFAAASQHFADVFDGEENQVAVVDFNDVSPAVFEIVLEYVYSGNSTLITGENVGDLLEASKILRIGTLEAACSEILPYILTSSNWWRIKAIAGEQQSEEVYKKCQAFALQHFQEIAESEAFLELPLDEVKGLVADRGVVVSCCEDELYSAVLRWVKHDLDNRRQNLFELLKDVKFTLMEKTFFMKIVNREPLLRADLDCANLLLETNDYHAGMEEPASASTTVSRERYFKKELVSYIFATGGWGHDSEISDCEVYNPRTNKWHAIASMQSCRRRHAVIGFGQHLYAFGGGYIRELSTVEYYDPVNDAWTWTAPLPHARLGHGICALNSFIYICGGEHKNKDYLSTVEQFDPSTGLYKPCAAMNTKRTSFKMAATGDSIYAIAGTNSQRLGSVERFDPREGRWTDAPSLSKQRADMGVAVLNEYIYCTGGYHNFQEVLSSGKRFDIRGNAWEPIPDMLTKRFGHELVTLDGCVYAIGGPNTNSVEKFDPDTNRWVEMPSMLHKRGVLGASALECTQINHR